MIKRHQRPWPLERAELIKRHNEAATRDARACAARVSAAERDGYERAVNDLALRYADDLKWRKLVYESAIRKLAYHTGHELGIKIDKAWRPFDEIINMNMEMRKRTLDAAMTRAVFDARSDKRAIDNVTQTVMQISVELLIFNYCMSPFD